MMRNLYCALIISIIPICAMAQGSFFGGLELNPDFYIRDSISGAAGTPHYDDLKNSVDGWFNLNYNNDKYKFDAGIRIDLFLNSNLHNPGTPYTAVGLGTFYVRKRIDKVRITGGYFYDQFGSGIVFRAYEDRTLGIDNSILGAHIEYDVLNNLKVKAFAGLEKNRFSLYNPVIIGANVEYDVKLGKEKKLQIIPGLSAVNRTVDQESMDIMVSAIKTYDEADRFVPRYNTYVFGAYNTLNIGGFSWYAEYAAKTHEALADEALMLFDAWGQVIYSTLTYSQKGFGITGQFKRTENFQFRTSPNETFLNGMIAYIPPISRQNSLRLPSRYNAASQELEELAYSLDVTFTPIKKVTFNINGSNITNFENELLFREFYFDTELKFKRNWKADVGFQFIQYDQTFYERESYGDYRLVNAYTPFIDFLWKINRKHSLRFEGQWQGTSTYNDVNTGKEEHADFGNWVFALVEYNISPWFSLAVSDMYNYKPNPNRQPVKIHYYSVYAAFTYNTTRFSVAYVKQVEGVVCTGGICRLEPAFNGVRLTFNTTF